MKILIVDACIRGKVSRTRQLLEAAVSSVQEEAAAHNVTVTFEKVDLGQEEILPLNATRLAERDRLVVEGKYDQPCFRYARQFAAADGIIVAAPFWDMSYPALLKLYLERVSVDGITFTATDAGLKGLCHGTHMLYLCTRGGFPEGNAEDAGAANLRDLCGMYGIPHFQAVCAYGTDLPDPSAVANSLQAASASASAAAKQLIQ